jgi:signal transduction histidine kinase
MPDGGTLSVDVRWDATGEGVQFSFADDGIGMDEQQQQLYFQPFNSSFRQGTGLGTAIVYRLVEEHGGKVHLDSRAGGGTCVRIDLPRRQTRGVPVRPAPFERQAAAGEVR